MSYDTLSLEGMDIDSVERSFAVLKAKYGEGYEDAALVGSAAGTHRWVLSSGALPDASSYGSLISSTPRFQYYWDFFQDHVSNGNEPFIIAFRGKNYHAGFVDTKISMEMFTIDLFGGGVEIEQRRIRGFTYSTDGSIPEAP